ncbi:MAG: TonB-dependent receptor [candidate division KSB1 bacterium]|nr:TonB-dependent receptor [candidate division KSB1 bacterium]MDZ7333866.1 TonB-dependent receptor [candidate division KSB1 bacterium]MDZ7358580.1 TonB-dependent receptor [candidate division KSB1 bacterium]MDZ7399112.1 TonB-dependent receptor [candidate division KSB1 bacterium]
MNKPIICMVILAILLTGKLYAAHGVIKGRVVDSATGDPLPGTNVWIKGTNVGAASDLKGYYTIANVPPGEYTLRVSYIGYETQELPVMVKAGETVVKDISLVYGQVLRGETVVVTAQASGQYTAINQQLASNTIANIVSKARIQELPDVNAAESIGRLPGVSIQRSGGEATKIEIRGLSPKYNTVTINGVTVPATGGDDRSVDLSLISSSMLDGIEVRKANTPDMDADVIGGTVDLKLKEAGEELAINATAQGGYNRLQNYYGNYNFMGSVSNRFLDGKLGIIATVNADDYDRSADKFSGNYREIQVAGVTGIAVHDISLREDNVKRGRTGASLLLDYRIPFGKVTANSFYNRLKWNGLFRFNRMNVNDNRHYYDLEDRGGTTSIFTGAVGARQDFNWIRYDFSVARTASRAESPEDRTWTFVQENAAFKDVTNETRAKDVPAHATVDSNMTGLSDIYIYDTKRDENQTMVQLNIEVPFRLTKWLSGYLKTGGKLRWLDRTNDENQYGRNGLQYGSATGVSQPLATIIREMAKNYPEEWDWIKDSTLVRKYGLLPIARVLSNYTRSDFLNGEYPLGFVADIHTMNKITDVFSRTNEWKRYAIGSRGRDYDGVERYQAAFIMAEFNFGKRITLLPGVRWEKDYSKYHGQRYREVVINNIQQDPTDLDSLENVRKNQFWLPMVHLRLQPAEWLRIRLARTETLTRPDYIHYAPITSINSYQSYIRAANALLKPAKSTNYDASISVYQNYVGLFTVSGFYKSIDDLIFQVRLKLAEGVPVPVGLNIPTKWLEKASPEVDTYLNNPNPAHYKGVELDWQTHFWYLPSVFKGLVLNVNYTRIFSDMKKQLYFLRRGPIIPGTRPPRYSNILVDSTRTARMPDQPAHIANITIGYDYKGFSTRLSFLYQTDKVTFISTEPILDNFSGAYARWDLTIQQNLTRSLQLFANFINLNNRRDQHFRGYTLTDPTYIEYYGFTMDIGIRYRL